MLRIGIDGQSLESKFTGIGRYVYELCKQLNVKLPYAHFFVYGKSAMEQPVDSRRWHYRTDTSFLTRYMTSYMWLKFRCGSLCQKDDLNVFWANRTLVPKLKASVKVVSTVHDLNYKIVPETMPLANLWAHRFYFKKDVMRADFVLANSRGTASRLYSLLGCRTDGIVQPSVRADFGSVRPNEVSDTLKAYGILTPYLLSVATREPRKNLSVLIESFLLMKSEGLLPRHTLVLVGGEGWKQSKLLELIGKDNHDNGIALLGFVADENLPALYKGADVFIFPSLYEGFGIPILEARASGTMVVTTDIPELREAGGNDSIYIPPTHEGIRHGILSALSKKRAAKKEKSLSTWAENAEILAAALTDRPIKKK